MLKPPAAAPRRALLRPTPRVLLTIRGRMVAVLVLASLLIMGALWPIHAQDAADQDITAQATTTPDAPPNHIAPGIYPQDINPLTGLPVSDPATLDRRPIVVKVSNSPALVRPQAGIGQADLVYEHYTEAGITRFSAIFYGEAPRRVGSIRSARLIDYELVPMYQGLLAFAGASIGVDKRIYGSEQVTEWLCATRDDPDPCRAEVDVVGPPGFIPPSDFVERAYKGVLIGPPIYARDPTLPVPHNLFVDIQALWERAAAEGHNQRPDLTGMTFSETPPPAVGSGTYAQVRYRTTTAEWVYDSDLGLYQRLTDGQPHFDANLEAPVRAANVVIVYVGHYLTDIVESQWQDTIHWSAQITLWPEGEAVLLRDGLRYEARWQRPTRPELLSLVTPDGAPLPFKPGNTWFQVVPLPEQMDSDLESVRVE